MNHGHLDEIVVFLHLVGHRVEAAREMAALTQAELAARSDLTPEVIAGLERGEYAIDIDQLHRIAEVLGRCTADLVPDMTSVRRRASGGR